jgi:hypothetical protein
MTNRRNKLDVDKIFEPGQGSGDESRDIKSLGPSDGSDSGSDMQGPGLIDDDLLGLDRGTNEDSEGGHLADGDVGASLGDLGADENSDRSGTGERITAGKEPDIRLANDIAPDRIVSAEEAGLGGGLDQAEEAQLGITDEELQALAEDDAAAERASDAAAKAAESAARRAGGARHAPKNSGGR